MEEVEILQTGKRISAPINSKEKLTAKIESQIKAEKSLKIMIPLLILALLGLSVNVIIAKKTSIKQEENYFQSQLHTQLYYE
jgi:hypothetical protein